MSSACTHVLGIESECIRTPRMSQEFTNVFGMFGNVGINVKEKERVNRECRNASFFQQQQKKHYS